MRRIRRLHFLGARRKVLFIVVVLTSLLYAIACHWSIPEPRDACRVADETFRRHESRLPKVIHQQWKSKSLPPHFAAWRSKLLATFPEPEFHHILWTDASQRQLIAANYSWFLTMYDAYPHDIMRADAARPFILHTYGGLYVDLDYEVLVDFWDRLPNDAPAVIEDPYNGVSPVQNALMSSPLGHEFWTVMWDILMEKSLDYGGWMGAGPLALRDAILRYTGPVYILPCENWNRVPTGTHLEHGKVATTMIRRFGTWMGVYKSCGDSHDLRCHWGIHHGTVTYSLW